MKKIYLILFLLIVLFIAGCSSGNTVNDQVIYRENSVSNKEPNMIEITSDGFSPNELKIKKGDDVTWINKDSGEYWPASAMHPTHTVYPGSDINKCGTDEEKNIFDVCKGLKQDESFSFTFNEKGTWFYHDHLNPKLFGKIIVE